MSANKISSFLQPRERPKYTKEKNAAVLYSKGRIERHIVKNKSPRRVQFTLHHKLTCVKRTEHENALALPLLLFSLVPFPLPASVAAAAGCFVWAMNT
jgi:hypothetical protein